MSKPKDWHRASIRQKLSEEFPGAWGNSPDGQQGNALALRSTNIDDVGNIEYRTGAERVLSESKLESKALQTGDIILEGSGGGKGKPVGRVALFEQPNDGRTYVCSNFFRTLRPSNDVDNRYLFWRLLHYWRQPSIWAHQQQTTSIINLKHKHYLATEFHWPPLHEQRRIADVLDTVDAAIQETDDVIAKQEQVKTGLLQDLLTRGLDDAGRLRDPETDPEAFRETEYGTVPQAWEIRPLREVADIGSGLTINRSRTKQNPVEIPYLRVANVQDGYLDLEEIKTVQVPESKVGRYLLEEGDMLMTEGGDFDKLGRGTVWEGQIEPCAHQNHIFRVRTKKNVLRSHFLSAVSGSSYGKQYFIRNSKQTTNLATINQSQLKRFPVLCPSLLEQDRILDRLEAHESLIMAEKQYLKKLQRLKTGLMQDLLTGRVRVPDAEERINDVIE